ncbi:MAG: YbaN family protein [Bacillota bacterium]|nr:YbaN family protein [Bacillota bacterium]
MSLKRKIKSCLLIAAGTLSLGLGVIGIFLPVLPTPPLLLLAAFCYIRSSEKLYSWLINHRVFGTYVNSYLTYGAIIRSTRTGALILLWSMLILTFDFHFCPGLVPKAVPACCGSWCHCPSFQA